MASVEAVVPPRSLLLRIAVFGLPYLMLALPLLALLVSVGEALPVKVAAMLQLQERPILYLPAYSDHTYAVKLQIVKDTAPHVLALGNSRINQVRSAMVAPYSFYNAGNAVYRLKDYKRFLEELGDARPKVVIFNIDFSHFSPAWDRNMRSPRGAGDWSANDAFYMSRRAITDLFSEGASRYFVPKVEPVYGLPAIGLNAIELGHGFRRDGSLQHGREIRGQRRNYEELVAEGLQFVAAGYSPFPYGDVLDLALKKEFEDFVAYAKRWNIFPIAITMPFAPEVAAALQESKKHGNYRAFQSSTTAEWIRSLGVAYFNYSDIESFGGDTHEFADEYHPGERAVYRMILQIVKNPEIRAHLPNIQVERLAAYLAASTEFEVFRNNF